MRNVIALCPEDHRRAHYGEDRESLERKMHMIVLRSEDRLSARW
jgi:hypothetical protein